MLEARLREFRSPTPPPRWRFREGVASAHRTAADNLKKPQIKAAIDQAI